MVADWLYQVRIKVDENLSNVLRKKELVGTSKEIYEIAELHGTSPVCTYDAFCDYCHEAEREGVSKYPLYEWTKQTIDDPVKKQKHTRFFAFYLNGAQVYEKIVAESLHKDLVKLYEGGFIEEVMLIDSNPSNNPQPPKQTKL